VVPAGAGGLVMKSNLSAGMR